MMHIHVINRRFTERNSAVHAESVNKNATKLKRR